MDYYLPLDLNYDTASSEELLELVGELRTKADDLEEMLKRGAKLVNLRTHPCIEPQRAIWIADLAAAEYFGFYRLNAEGELVQLPPGNAQL